MEPDPKLDAKFTGAIRKVKDQSIVPDSEWLVFLAKDNAFAAVLPQYVAECRRLGCDQEQIEAIERAVLRVDAWRARHPDRLKNPDAANEKLLDVK